ncbi:hypothetical protein RCL1_001032 [Eukaryota sp. TZLM3-RCL]
MPGSRSLLHALLDFDSFYCSVELARVDREHPELKIREKPVGIIQRDSLIAINYVARNLGVPKMCSLATARSICPSITVFDVNLQAYRDVSLEAFKLMSVLLLGDEFLKKASIDEAYFDLTPRIKELLITNHPIEIVNIIKTTVNNNDRVKISSCL